MDESPLKRLGQFVKDTRLDQRLSVRGAAIEAGIDRSTWSTLEDGSRRLSEHLWPAVERALDWSPGSVKAILAGGEPTPITGEIVTNDRVTAGTARAVATAHAVTSRSGDFDLAEEIDFVSQQHQIPVEERMRMVKRLVQLWREHQEREEAARVQARAATK